MINDFASRLRQIILDEKERQIFLARVVYGALAIVALFMTVVNVLTGKDILMWSTLLFFIFCVADLVLTFIGPRCIIVSSFFFQVEMIALFSFFIVSGSPEGFSAFWAALLPLCGMLLWGVKRGALDSLVMFLIIIFFCWTDYGRSFLQFDYTQSFLLRFPFLYIAFFFVSFLLCIVLFYVQDALSNQSKHDPLTKALNRVGLAEYMHDDLTFGHSDTVGFIIMDLDFFKKVNDTYGHQIGDDVLVYAVNLVSKVSPFKICRWGGEEFSIYCADGNQVETIANEIVQQFRKNVFVNGDIRIEQTISVGGITIDRKKAEDMNTLSHLADECLYEAKNTGRNKAIVKQG